MPRLFILILLITLFSSSNAGATADSHRQAVEELLTVSRVDKMIEPMMDNVMSAIQQQMGQLDIPEDKRPVIEKYNQKIVETVRQDMKWEKMKDDFVTLYLEVYTEEEIRGLIDFYTSPLGQKMLDKMPELMQQSLQISQKMLRETLPKIQQLSEEMAVELQASGK